MHSERSKELSQYSDNWEVEPVQWRVVVSSPGTPHEVACTGGSFFGQIEQTW